MHSGRRLKSDAEMGFFAFARNEPARTKWYREEAKYPGGNAFWHLTATSARFEPDHCQDYAFCFAIRKKWEARRLDGARLDPRR
jgi:hypothetical protein